MERYICIEERSFEQLNLHLESLVKIAEQLQQQVMPKMSNEWMDSSEVCRILKISKRTLHYYREKGIIPFTNGKGKMLYKRDDIMDFLSTRTVNYD